MRLQGHHILVVEDSPDVLDVLTMLLLGEGATVVGTASGLKALTLFRSRRFDVVLADLGLPDIAGDEMIRALRVLAGGHPLTVVVITGENGPAATRALEAGAAVIFPKPCPWQHVLTYLEGLRRAPAAA